MRGLGHAARGADLTVASSKLVPPHHAQDRGLGRRLRLARTHGAAHFLQDVPALDSIVEPGRWSHKHAAECPP
jgi:hypothetical protein